MRLNKTNSSQVESTADVRVIFQRDVFIDNTVGWISKPDVEIIVPAFCFSVVAMREFTDAARAWLELPIDQLGAVYFVGEWNLAKSPYQFTLSFDRYPDTPSKTDWFAVRVYLQAGNFIWNRNLHIDYTCLALFVAGLTTEGFTNS